jgi:hypothetical protein
VSYHDGYERPSMEGRATVNPLIRIERQLAKIRKLLSEEKKIKDLSGDEVGALIKEILDE